MARLLSQARLLAIAKRWEENLPERAIVLPRQESDLGGGDTEVTYPSPATTGLTRWNCRLQPTSSADEAALADREQSKVWWDVTLPVRSRVKPTDRLYVTGRDAKGGSRSRLLEVSGTDGPRTWEARRVVRCWEILPAE